LLAEDEVEIVIQINGKLRDRIKMPNCSYRGRTEGGRAIEPENSRPDRWEGGSQSDCRSKKLVNIVVT
jgi:hypothetical protein